MLDHRPDSANTMTKILYLIPATLALFCATLAAGAAPRVVYSCDFDGAAPPQWAAQPEMLRAGGEVRACRVVSGRSASGRQSLKLDFTLAAHSTLVWWKLPFKVPLSARPKISAKVWTGRSNTILALSYVAPADDFDQRLWRDFKLGRSGQSGGWETLTADASNFGSAEDPYKTAVPPDGYIDGFGVYLDRDWTEDDGHVVLWIDDITVTADVPEGFQPAFEASLNRKYADVIARASAQRQRDTEARIRRWSDSIDSRAARLEQAEHVAAANPLLSELQARLRQEIDDLLPKLRQEIDAVARASGPCGTGETPVLHSAQVRRFELAADALIGIAEYPADWSSRPYWIGEVDPTRGDRVLADSYPPAAAPAHAIRIEAARGEYEPASIVITAGDKGLRGMTIGVSDLRQGDRAIPADAVDVRWVKRWWQAGHEIDISTRPQLVPELLLHDPAFVSVSGNAAQPRNVLKLPEHPTDAPSLQPVDVPAGANQQVWLTARIPDDAAAGTYEGTIAVTFADGTAGVEIPFVVDVHPFDLAESRWDSSIYYRGSIAADPPPLDGKKKTPEQFEREMRDMRIHGIDNPTSITGFTARPDGTFDFSRLKEDFEIRRRAGMLDADKPVVVLNTPVQFRAFAAATAPAQRRQIIEASVAAVRAAQEFCRANGYPEIYHYAIDEAVGEQLEAERELMRAVHEAGGKIAVACEPGYFKVIGEYLDRPIVYDGSLTGRRPPSTDEYRLSQALGYRVWVYGRPQGGVEDPEIYRRNYGLMLWKRGEDGACTYAYQAEMPEHGNIWDDFDNPGRYRDHVMAYPTADGVIDTIQWEGYREGVDDLRYLSTLLSAIDAARHDGRAADVAGEAQRWLDDLDIDRDLTAIRRQMAEWIIRIGAE